MLSVNAQNGFFNQWVRGLNSQHGICGFEERLDGTYLPDSVA
jgi:hypothetical protein